MHHSIYEQDYTWRISWIVRKRLKIYTLKNMVDSRKNTDQKTIGIALGSGAARGWAHIGVLQELHSMGIEADIVCGTSIGALVGAAYAKGRLDALEEWVLGFDRREVIRHLDIKLLVGGGFVEGKRLIHALKQVIGDAPIEDLPRTYAAVASDLATGSEVWFKKGSLMEAIRASIALPGLFIPVKREKQWLVDGGLVNPVPVSLCRAMGATTVIAVNLNGEIVGKHVGSRTNIGRKDRQKSDERTVLDKLLKELKQKADSFLPRVSSSSVGTPGLFEVLADSLNIMQDRITRSRMAGDPPDIVLAPRIAHIALLEFGRAEEAIHEGRACVRRMTPALQHMMRLSDP